jgi:tRNA pseudouridine38-40 synthase
MTEAAEKPPPQARNVKLVIAYDGTRYHGWQRQGGGIPTVQECLELAAARIVGHPVSMLGAGRTDAGVHAAGQVANFQTVNRSIPLSNFRRALNAGLPPDVAAISAEEVPADFHASLWAVGKTYRYRIYRRPLKPVTRANQVYHYWRQLDAERMSSGGARLLGEHDFRGFAYAAEKRKSTLRRITRCDVSEDGDELHVTVSGNGFLYKMVRNIVGTLIEIGRGRWGPGRIDEILKTRDRGLGGPTAPPGGLCLLHVEYPPWPRATYP